MYLPFLIQVVLRLWSEKGVIDPLDSELDTSISIVCIYGESFIYPWQRLKLTIMGQTEEILVGFTRTLPCPMLVGQDWPYFYEMLDQVQEKGELPAAGYGEDPGDGFQGEEDKDPTKEKKKRGTLTPTWVRSSGKTFGVNRPPS